MIPDMTPNRMLLDVSVSPEKDTTILILISMKFNYIVLFFPNWDHFIITIYILVQIPAGFVQAILFDNKKLFLFSLYLL